jgi:hypothetical protein
MALPKVPPNRGPTIGMYPDEGGVFDPRSEVLPTLKKGVALGRAPQGRRPLDAVARHTRLGGRDRDRAQAVDDRARRAAAVDEPVGSTVTEAPRIVEPVKPPHEVLGLAADWPPGEPFAGD